MFSKRYYLYPIAVGIFMQFVKVCIDVFLYKKRTRKVIFASWWFPSVHSALASSIFTLVVLVDWFDSILSAVVLVFSFLWWYDAISVRYESWKHAEYLNFLAEKTWYESKEVFKERIWHNIFEVIAWIILWFIMTICLYDFHLFTGLLG